MYALAPNPELHALAGAGAGPHLLPCPTTAATAMLLEALPPEIWHSIIMCLDDRCFAWFVLRQVSPFMASVTEDVFARYVSRTCSVRFAGTSAENLILPDEFCTCMPKRHSTRASLQPPTFRFLPSAFVPTTTKARLVLKLCDSTSTQEMQDTFKPHAWFDISLSQVFFKPGADAERSRLLNEPQFVVFDNELKSLRLPSAVIDVAAQEISLDWRLLCDTFMRDQLKCRYETVSSVAWWRTFE
ncbi:hypothetical protein BDW02DRAFT_296729 [Decorospora gaudefroyi]|uniref:F-box domain-containing protein n=1 Tax=Decorospora gaudefroyi TaxID=184978 RepID=A0A6A5KGE5_9PLEO|nr:hypothetical protein BDW02DRAFT_296729 [Decorospora gaudefroyi]